MHDARAAKTYVQACSKGSQKSYAKHLARTARAKIICRCSKGKRLLGGISEHRRLIMGQISGCSKCQATNQTATLLAAKLAKLQDEQAKSPIEMNQV